MLPSICSWNEAAKALFRCWLPQVAAQEGKYLAKLFSRHAIAPQPGAMPAAAAVGSAADNKQIDTGAWVPLPEGVDPFK